VYFGNYIVVTFNKLYGVKSLIIVFLISFFTSLTAYNNFLSVNLTPATSRKSHIIQTLFFMSNIKNKNKE